MISVDCTELTVDEKLALASRISTVLEGKAVALAKGQSIVLDELSDQKISLGVVRKIVDDFVASRPHPEGFSVETAGDTIMVHSPDPVAALSNRRENNLPPNLQQCPFCPFVTPYEELYVVHLRSHFFGV